MFFVLTTRSPKLDEKTRHRLKLMADFGRRRQEDGPSRSSWKSYCKGHAHPPTRSWPRPPRAEDRDQRVAPFRSTGAACGCDHKSLKPSVDKEVTGGGPPPEKRTTEATPNCSTLRSLPPAPAAYAWMSRALVSSSVERRAAMRSR